MIRRILWLFVRNVILKIVLEMGSSKGSNVTDVKAVDISIPCHTWQKP